MTKVRKSVGDLAARESLMVNPGRRYGCPKCHQDIKFTLDELRKHTRLGETASLPKTCPSCRRHLLALVERKDVDGQEQIQVIDLQLYPG